MQSDGGLLTSVLVAGALCLHHGPRPGLPAAAEPESSKYWQIEFIEEIVKSLAKRLCTLFDFWPCPVCV